MTKEFGLPNIKAEGTSIIYDPNAPPSPYIKNKWKRKLLKIEGIITDNWRWYWKIMHKLFKRTDGW